jgi:hypothetical protein
MTPNPSTQRKITEYFIRDMETQLGTTNSSIAEGQLVDLPASGLSDNADKWLAHFFEVLTRRNFRLSLLSPGEYRPGHALDLQHTGTSSTGGFTGASGYIDLYPFLGQLNPATDFAFPPAAQYVPPAPLPVYTHREWAIDLLAENYPTISIERVADIVDEAIRKLENISSREI